MTEIEKELKRFIASGKATKKDYSGGFLTTYIDPLKIAKHFAQWQKEQMMKDAIGGFVVEMLNIDGGVAHKYVETDFLPAKEYEKGQEVKVIIIKE